MPQSAATKTYLTFIGGLVTEVNPMVYPENTCKDLDNVDLYRQGYIRRRLGVDFETSYAYSEDSWTSDEISTYAITKHEWRSVNGNGDLNFLVVQVGGYLYFYNLGADVVSTAPIGKINIYSIRTSEDYYTYPIDAASGKGRLFIVGRRISPAYIEYDEEENSFSGVKITVKIRDIDGLDEETESPDVFGDDVTPDPTPYEDQVDQDITDPVSDVDLSQISLGYNLAV